MQNIFITLLTAEDKQGQQAFGKWVYGGLFPQPQGSYHPLGS